MREALGVSILFFAWTLQHAAAAGLCSFCRSLPRSWSRACGWVGCNAAGAGESETAREVVCMLAAENDSIVNESHPMVDGVPPNARHRFASIALGDTDGVFSCFDGSGQFPASVVNDDFCDCRDGSDEPGSGACAERAGRCFFCHNERSVAKFIYASRVGDGICDCCDGSDERGHADDANICSNNCEEEGAELRAAGELRKQQVSEGLRLFDGAKEAAANATFAWRADHARLEAGLPSLEKQLKEARELRGALQERVDEERSAAAAAAAAKAAALANASNLTDDSASHTEAAKVVEVTDESSTAVIAEVADESRTPVNEPEVSEYAKWAMDQQKDEVPLSPSSAVSDDKPSAEGVEEDVEEDASDGESSEGQSELERQLTQAKATFDAAEATVQDAKRRRDDLDKKLKLDLGDEQRWFSLVDKCVEEVRKEYTYKICFFDRVTQDYTSLGRFEGWAPEKNYFVMSFSHGERCHGGPDRSVRVALVCGSAEEILGFSEPSRCAYEAQVSHPAACRPGDLDALESRPGIALMPHVEL